MKRLILLLAMLAVVLVPSASGAVSFSLAAEQSWDGPNRVLYTVNYHGGLGPSFYVINHQCRDADGNLVLEESLGILWFNPPEKKGWIRGSTAGVSCSAYVYDVGSSIVGDGDESGPLSNILVYDPAGLPPFDGF